MQTDKLVTAYFNHYRLMKTSSDFFWAWEDVQYLVERDPVQAWSVIVELINAAPSWEAIAFVAAGPLEDIISKRGKFIIEKLEQALPQNKRLQYAIAGVWLEEEDEFFTKLETLKNSYNLDKINPLNGEAWSDDNLLPG
ncbi:MAG TPA: hypothetical protein V6C89_16215 [Drouetiella sp.]